MTREDIIRMAREADPGFDGGQNVMELLSNSIVGIAAIERFANLVAAQNRPWVGMTNDEIKSLPSWWPSYEDAPALIKLVKDVEAKLKEKNNGI